MGRKLQQYNLLKERVMHETQLLRQRMDESRSGGNAKGSREAGNCHQWHVLQWPQPCSSLLPSIRKPYWAAQHQRLRAGSS